jgi:hypothetical protein
METCLNYFRTIVMLVFVKILSGKFRPFYFDLLVKGRCNSLWHRLQKFCLSGPVLCERDLYSSAHVTFSRDIVESGSNSRRLIVRIMLAIV